MDVFDEIERKKNLQLKFGSKALRVAVRNDSLDVRKIVTDR